MHGNMQAIVALRAVKLKCLASTHYLTEMRIMGDRDMAMQTFFCIA
ncbi:hypothetical protein [Pelosinus propionicus]|nr:hypothetical protein [Pelosinus propionicus]